MSPLTTGDYSRQIFGILSSIFNRSLLSILLDDYARGICISVSFFARSLIRIFNLFRKFRMKGGFQGKCLLYALITIPRWLVRFILLTCVWKFRNLNSAEPKNRLDNQISEAASIELVKNCVEKQLFWQMTLANNLFSTFPVLFSYFNPPDAHK